MILVILAQIGKVVKITELQIMTIVLERLVYTRTSRGQLKHKIKEAGVGAVFKYYGIFEWRSIHYLCTRHIVIIEQ